RAGMGALIVVSSDKLENMKAGGFNVNSSLTHQKIVELSKMDGAIILSDDLKKIMHANVLLFPDISIKTDETGTRHQAAERTAKQAETLVIAISERRRKITIYHGNIKYILQNTNELLSRAVETLQILEKQREILDELMSNLNVLEISGLVVVSDVCSVLQRMEMIMRTAKMMDRYLIELGKEGGIIKMRLRELLRNIDKEKELILRDYGVEKEKEEALIDFAFDDLLEMENISSILFSASLETKVQAKGYRILDKIDLKKETFNKIIEHFENLESILSSDANLLNEVLGDEAESFQKDLSSLKEQIMMAKKI
ncbi:MAG: DNA integrity scanning diadenylate cyclase DisA, partial [Nanoarchaeota archaeon]|nr:DNA integrity scanning diadenylate cyclase DisA [Nanoarchaeota archaeon]